MYLAVRVLDINIIIPGASQRDHPDAVSVQLIDDLRIDCIIHKDTYGIAVARELCRVRCQFCIEELEFYLPVLRELRERIPVI